MVDGASFLVFRVSACLEMPSRQGRRLSINIHFLKPFFRFGCPVPFAHASRLRRNIKSFHQPYNYRNAVITLLQPTLLHSTVGAH